MSMIILGIDPGSRITGYGIIQEKNKIITYIDSGCIRASSTSLSERLTVIYQNICQIIDQYKPNAMAIESVFMHQNPNAALKLGHARGVAILAGALQQIPITDYSPRTIKQAVVGYGAAEKAQVNKMVMHLLSLNKSPQQDAADALAIAMCHYHSHNKKDNIHDWKT